MDNLLTVILGVVTPFLYKVVPLKGYAMVLFTWLAGFALAAADLYVTGGTAGWTIGNIAIEFAKLYAVQQGAFAFLNQGAPNAVK